MSQGKIGWRPYSGAQSISTLLNSLYSSWNGDVSGSGLNTSIYGAWNGESLGTSLDTSLYAVYNGESNTNDSFGTNNGTAQGNLTYTTGKIGNAFTFNGTNAYVSIPRTTNEFDFTGDFSISVWIKPTANSANYKIFQNFYGTTNTNRYGYNLYLQSGLVRFATYKGNTGALSASVIAQAPTTIVGGTWYHIVITKTTSNAFKIYINGSLQTLTVVEGDLSLTPVYSSSNQVNIGSGFNNGTRADYFNGQIDSLNTWTKSLTDNEVSQLYNGGSGAQYPYSSQSLPSPIDSVGTNHGILMNGCTFTTGKIGSAFTFDGVNDYVNFPTNSWNSTVGTDFSVSLWVKFTSTASQTLISNMSAPSVNNWSGWEIRLVSGRPTIYMWNNAGVSVGAQGAVISTNTWYHIVATRKKGSRTRIYINGSLAQTDTNTPDPSINGTYYPNIGHLQYTSSDHFLYMANGSLIDAVNLWNREITAEEVSQLYNGGSGVQYPYTNAIVASAKNSFGIDNGTLMNGCSITDGKIGKAFTFDGVNDYVQLPNNSLNLTNNYSINLWLYLPSAQSSTLLSVFGNDGTNKGFYIDITNLSSYTFRFVGFNNGTNVIALNGSGGIGYLNRWTMATLTVSGTSVKIYLDGTLSASGIMSSPINYIGTTYPTLGAYRNGSGTPSGYLINGTKVDGFSVWKKELTQAEITELYNSGAGKQIEPTTTIVTDGLVLNLDASRTSSYPGSGTTWTDISGNSLNGTLTNGVGYTAGNEGSLVFDGINDYVSLPDSATLQPANITISTWFKLNQYSTNYVYGNANACLIRKGMYGYEISVRQDGKLLVFAYSDVNNQNQYLIDSISLNTWYNVVLTFGNSQMKVYINNVLVGTYATSTNSIYYAGGGISIGRQAHWDMYYFNGNIGQTMVYNRALTSTEITQNYNATKTRFGL